jgi:hypothetical protein
MSATVIVMDIYQVSLRCSTCEEHGTCEKKQETPVQVWSRHPTLIACLQDLLKRLQDRHDECAQVVAKAEKAAADTPNVMQVMMVFQQGKDRSKTTQDHVKAS